MENFKLFKTFLYQAESLIIKSLFENENIRFYIKNETTVATHPFASLAMGGVILFVHLEDFNKAEKLCQKLEL